MAKPTAKDFSMQGDRYLGTPYEDIDCQKLVERMMEWVGIKRDLKGSNAWYREFLKNGWVGTPEECKAVFGMIPDGAVLFIWANDGGERARGYTDGLGNASHIGVKTGRTAAEMLAGAKKDGANPDKDKVCFGDGAIHSSSSRECVATSRFEDKTIKGGGWNRVGLHPMFRYGGRIDDILSAWKEAGEDDDPTGHDEQQDVPKDETGGETGMIQQAKVVLPEGKTGVDVFMRSGKGKNYPYVARVPVGEIVNVDNDEGTWCHISWAGKSGWMDSNYLEYITDGDEPGTIEISAEGAAMIDDAMRRIDEIVEWLGSVKDQLQDAIDTIGGVVGRG